MHIQFETTLYNQFTGQDEPALINYYAHEEWTDCGRYKYFDIELASVQFYYDDAWHFSEDYEEDAVLRCCERHFDDESRDLEAEFLLHKMENNDGC